MQHRVEAGSGRQGPSGQRRWALLRLRPRECLLHLLSFLSTDSRPFRPLPSLPPTSGPAWGRSPLNCGGACSLALYLTLAKNTSGTCASAALPPALLVYCLPIWSEPPRKQDTCGESGSAPGRREKARKILRWVLGC